HAQYLNKMPQVNQMESRVNVRSMIRLDRAVFRCPMKSRRASAAPIVEEAERMSRPAAILDAGEAPRCGRAGRGPDARAHVDRTVLQLDRRRRPAQRGRRRKVSKRPTRRRLARSAQRSSK